MDSHPLEMGQYIDSEPPEPPELLFLFRWTEKVASLWYIQEIGPSGGQTSYLLIRIQKMQPIAPQARHSFRNKQF
jgi:hypothetical protein